MRLHINMYSMDTDPILYLHYEGYAPSEIARMLKRDEKYVHDYIVAAWRAERAGIRR